MKRETFIARLERGKSNNYTYSGDNEEGLIAIWKHFNDYILTWEECPKGRQYDESEYTRDEKHVFASLDSLLSFLKEHAIEVENFTP